MTKIATTNNFYDFDVGFMQRALHLAEVAADHDEVPVGAVLVKDQNIIGEGYNQPISTNDPTAHAEIIAMRMAGETLQNYRLVDTTLYVTLEPCAMCLGAMLHARIKRLVFACVDPKSGAVCGATDLLHAAKWNHSIEYRHGLLAEASKTLLQDFFKARR